MQTVNIFMAVDNNFLEYTLAVIKWLKKYSTKKISLYICVPDNETKDKFNTVLKTLKTSECDIKIISFIKYLKHRNFVKNFEKRGYHLPISTFFRLFISDFIPHNIDKIIYLDADLIINTDIAELYSIQLSKTIGWVDGIHGKKWSKKYLWELGLQITDYINAGVLLINLKKWRKLNMENKILSFAEKNFSKLKLGDQDLINIFFQNEIEYINPRWNNIVWHGTLLTKNEKSIFHTVWEKKADHPMFPHYWIKKMYLSLSQEEKSQARDTLNIIIYILLWKPVWYWELLWYKSKSEIQMSMHEYFCFYILILHPWVMAKMLMKCLRKINITKMFS